MHRTLQLFDAAPAASRQRLAQLVRAAIVGAVALAALPAAHANTTIDFEGLGNPLIGSNDYFTTTSGFYIGGFSNDAGAQDGDLVGAIVDGSDPGGCVALQCPGNNHSNYYAAVNDGVLDIGRVNQTFAVKSFDASFLGATPGATYAPVSGLLRIEGVRANGSTATEDYALAGPSGGGFQFNHFSTSASFGSQQFTEMYLFGFSCDASANCVAFQSDKGQFAIDNITAAVPEPSSWLMMGLGLFGVAAVARRRQA